MDLERLRRELEQRIVRIKSAQGIARALVDARKGESMPEIGGRKVASAVRTGLAGLKKQLDELHLDAAGALTELATEIQNGKEGVKRIRAETAEVKSAFAEILGNEGSETS